MVDERFDNTRTNKHCQLLRCYCDWKKLHILWHLAKRLGVQRPKPNFRKKFEFGQGLRGCRWKATIYTYKARCHGHVPCLSRMFIGNVHHSFYLCNKKRIISKVVTNNSFHIGHLTNWATDHTIYWSLIIPTTLTFDYGRTSYISPLSANFFCPPPLCEQMYLSNKK